MVAKFSLTDSVQINLPETQTQMHVYKETGPSAIPMDVHKGTGPRAIATDGQQ